MADDDPRYGGTVGRSAREAGTAPIRIDPRWETLLSWPGKSPTQPGAPCHPAVCHMLDVAAVAEVLLEDETRPIDQALRDALCLLVALHDLGKIGPDFRAMIENGERQLFRHWEVSEAWLLGDDIEDALLKRLGCPAPTLRHLVAAIAGHHGRPPRAGGDDLDRMVLHARAGYRATPGRNAEADALDFARVCLELWPQASLASLTTRDAAILSWWLSGLTVAADWIGSSPDWFPADPAPATPRIHLDAARIRARLAVAAAGLAAPAVSEATLFSFRLRPMQAAARDIALPDGATLAFIEDETGSGKTEAALSLAHRMLRAGKGSGLFFALPTMATADAMFLRARRIVGDMFEQPPSLTLAHGRAGLSGAFREVQAGGGASDDVVCGPWLADSRRRALLATVGVGTIDQALLAALPTKFATLRHWGLSRKVLIVDEVHELGDPYLATELSTLLRLHAAQGGSAILMTATLPLAQRRDLAAAFAEGAGLAAPEPMPRDYPALTIVGGAHVADFGNAGSDTVSDLDAFRKKGPVVIRRIDTPGEAERVIREAARDGAACVWIRNSVDDAIAALEALRAAGVPADLLHARFALIDRKRAEARALDVFGKESGDARRGRVLVATQVVEASLDLDFDVMVSDLAPIASLIQRAGRLWRHMDRRPAGARPTRHPTLHVLAPDPDARISARWLHRLQPGGAWVYPVADQWRTARALAHAGEIRAPDGLRDLIERVHGPDAEPVPATLLRAEMLREGENQGILTLARQNVIAVEAGYRDGGGAADDREIPTRLGQKTRKLMLARDGVAPAPWADGLGASRPEAEMLSEVSASAARLSRCVLPDQTDPRITRLTSDWPDWRRASVTVCPVGADGAICDGLGYDPGIGLIFGDRS